MAEGRDGKQGKCLQQYGTACALESMLRAFCFGWRHPSAAALHATTNMHEWTYQWYDDGIYAPSYLACAQWSGGAFRWPNYEQPMAESSTNSSCFPTLITTPYEHSSIISCFFPQATAKINTTKLMSTGRTGHVKEVRGTYVLMMPTALVRQVRYGKTGLLMPIITCGGMRQQYTWQAQNKATNSDITTECQDNFQAIVDR